MRVAYVWTHNGAVVDAGPVRVEGEARSRTFAGRIWLNRVEAGGTTVT
ncbi:hypothetical protein SAMN05443637_10243 [Pseudonocardia thermophila]|jgi:hypothetical protein|uniref:Uncharacterized protein n=2 Tax=Pseudonocardia thermophila TaxID=1848 RepID=A0A1M6P4H6_PSETH|nr:hypothetical protein [Pseudonocardia thermophila]SHK02828.1 hypothetical protein SAMN05443637_10243 [Pseudonocardia thermophila]